jgi:hypothetical protein
MIVECPILLKQLNFEGDSKLIIGTMAIFLFFSCNELWIIATIATLALGLRPRHGFAKV